MADINALLQQIMSAIYGEDVRQSIHDAIQAINSDVNTTVETTSNVLQETINLIAAVGKPFTASTASQMTNTERIYVYTGDERDYVTGDWYYYNGTEWVSGGPYNASVNSNLILGTGSRSIIENDIDDNTASGDYAHAEGMETSASGYRSHAEGGVTVASGDTAHAENYNTTASGTGSHSEGYHTEASGDYSHVEGRYTVAASDYQHVRGKYNVVDEEGLYAEIIGNGEDDESRSNARTLTWDGSEELAGGLKIGGDLEIGSEGDTLTPSKIRALESIDVFLKSMREVKTVQGPSCTFEDGAEGMPVISMPIEIVPIVDEETGAITGTGSITITANENEFVGDFSSIGLIYGATYNPITGSLTVTEIGNQMLWGDMTFSIDPDNYLGKRIPLPGCLSGDYGSSENSMCNVTDEYLYDQSASTHYYIYKDEVEEGYAVVVLPDDTPDDTIIQVVGTLETPIEYMLEPLPIKTVVGHNAFAVDTGEIETLSYYRDVIKEDIETLRHLIEEGYGLDTGFTIADRAKLESIDEGAEVNQLAYSSIRSGIHTWNADEKTDQLEIDTDKLITVTKTDDGHILFSIGLGLFKSEDYAETPHPYIYPDGNLYPDEDGELFPSNGRYTTSGIAIDFATGVIYGARYKDMIDSLDERVTALEEHNV